MILVIIICLCFLILVYCFGKKQKTGSSPLKLLDVIQRIIPHNQWNLENSIKISKKEFNKDRYICLIQDQPISLEQILYILDRFQACTEIRDLVTRYFQELNSKNVNPSIIFGWDGKKQAIKVYLENGHKFTDNYRIIDAYRWNIHQNTEEIEKYVYYNFFDKGKIDSLLRANLDSEKVNLFWKCFLPYFDLSRTHCKMTEDKDQSARNAGFNFKFKPGTKLTILTHPSIQGFFSRFFPKEINDEFKEWLSSQNLQQRLYWMFIGLDKDLVTSFYIREK